ncbi:MAG: VOC family protein [Acidimicrobiia bacterium]|nr:VOC family protein [Acidimicrobiia bacterium]
MQSFKVDQIDHVELFVPERYTAARWYEQTLGLRILHEREDWAGPGGPLMISSDGGGTMLALFEGEPRRNRATAGHHRVAFRVTAAGFLQFLTHVREVPVYSDFGEPVHQLSPVDHGKAFSVYFCDPYGNRFEVTSYEYLEVEKGLASV